MSRFLAAAVTVAVLAFPPMTPAAFAGHSTNKVGTPATQQHNNHHFFPDSYGGGTEPPELYASKCLPWSSKLHTWVWVCGPPYPPGYPVAR